MTTLIRTSNLAPYSIDASQALSPNTVELHHCSWYSSTSGDVGGLKLPRGTTDERPPVNVGGREKITFDLTVSQPDIEHNDPSFNMMDPWIWSWTGNYNRATQTNLTVEAGSSPGITLYRGSTYIFRNFTVGHSLWIKSQALSQAEFEAGTVDLYKLGAADGVTNNGAKRTVGSTEPAIITWTIPSDFAYNQVVIQHSQYGMNNNITIATPAKETLGYIRLNTDIGHDPTTNTGLEVYTGTGWKTVPFEENVNAVQAHPTDTLFYEDNGTLIESVILTSDAGVITDSVATTDNLGGLKLLAFLADGKLSINNNALIVHDGVTSGGIAMLRADQANTPDTLVNKRFSVYRCNAQTLTATNVNGSITSRIAFTNQLVNGISGMEFNDSNKLIRMTKDVPANSPPLYKFDFKFKPNQACTLQLWKNGSRITNADYDAIANYHNHFMWIETGAFNDEFEFRISYSGGSVSINSTDILTIEFLGS